MDENYIIKDASLEDKEIILNLIGLAIDSGAYDKIFVNNTPLSVRNIYHTDFLPILCNQDPFVIIYCGQEAVGISAASTFVNAMYDLRHKCAIGTLTFIKSGHRGNGLLKKTHDLMTKKLKDMGIKKLMVERVRKKREDAKYQVASSYLILDI